MSCTLKRKVFLAGFVAAMALAVSAAGRAENASPPPAATPDAQERVESELDAAFRAARTTMQQGPAQVKLGGQATLRLPKNYIYVPPKESAQLLRAMGNHPGDNLLGTVFPGGETDAGWIVVIRFDGAGYIKDDDANDWDAEELLQSLKHGTEQANQDRKARGIPELEVIGWVETPHYDPDAHQLVWSVAARDKGAPESAGNGINYNTYTLGREGYISMNLVTDLAAIEADKPAAKTLLANLTFDDGKRYADFDASTDKVAAYGLGALVAGVVAKKLGLFAIIAALFAKFWKVALIAVAAGGGALAKLFKRGKQPRGGTPA